MADEIGPLDGVRVLDFGWVWAGPLMSALLADLGAEVIKVESQARLDATRRGRPMIHQDIAGGDAGKMPEVQPLNHGLNRNKLSITVNLQTDEGRALLLQLATKCDVVCNNFRAGVMDRYGLGHADLRALKPELVVLSLSGAGQSGPWRDLATFAPTVTTLAGVSILIGYPGEAPLGRMQASYGDTNAALFGVVAILSALNRRNATGDGASIDLSQWESAICGTEELLLDYQMTGRNPKSVGNESQDLCPHNNYRCAGGSWISLAVGSEYEWAGLCRVLVGSGLNDSRYSDAFLRWRNRDQLDAEIEAATSTWEVKDLERALRAEGVAAAEVMNIGDQFADPHLQARGLYQSVEHPVVGQELIYGTPWRFSRTPATIRKAAPLLGEANDYVFGQLLGMTAGEIDRLKSLEVVY